MKARSDKYQMTIAKLPMAKELSDFDFSASPVNEPLVRDLATGAFLQGKRNLVLVGGTGSGKTHLSVAIARACIRNGARARCYNVVDLVNHLDAEARAGNQGRTGNQLCRRDLVILDELGYLPSRRPAENCCSISSASSTRSLRSQSPRTFPSASGHPRSATRR